MNSQPSPEMLTFFLASVFEMKSLSNLIFKTKSNGIMFDRDFILKMKPKKKWALDEMLFVLKNTKFQLKKKQQATYPSILLMNFKMKKSHCSAPMERQRQSVRESEGERKRTIRSHSFPLWCSLFCLHHF